MNIYDFCKKIHINRTSFSSSLHREQLLFCEAIKSYENNYYLPKIKGGLDKIKNNLYNVFNNIRRYNGYDINEIVRKNHILKFNEDFTKPSTRAIAFLTTIYIEQTKTKLLYICNQISLFTNNMHR